MLPDFEAWAVFAKVAERGGFTAAADELGLSKPTVSKAVTRLEQRLGIPLFHRSSRRLSLTEAGTRALERARALVSEAEQIEADITECAQEPRGTVRLAAPMSFGIRHLGQALPAFLDRYPQVTVDLRLGDARVDLIAGGIDVALRIGVLDDSALRSRRLLDVRTVVVASPAYLARAGTPAHPRDLEGHEAILYSHLSSPTIWHFDHPLEGRTTVRMKSRMLVDNADVATPALLAGIGIAREPEFLIWDELRSGALVEILPQWSSAAAGLHVITPPASVRPARVTALIEFLAARFARAPWAHGVGTVP